MCTRRRRCVVARSRRNGSDNEIDAFIKRIVQLKN
jgi:hypothetical protein